MSRALLTILLLLHLAMPVMAQAVSQIRSPLSISLREYGFMLAIAIIGGMASWWGKVSRGEMLVWNITALVGELVISAFSGLMAFYGCEYLNLNPLLTALVVGMSGHAGAKGIAWLESLGQKMVEKRLGINASEKEKP